VQLADAALPIEGDATQLQQILMNLVHVRRNPNPVVV
jgi:hypothetical protein